MRGLADKMRNIILLSTLCALSGFWLTGHSSMVSAAEKTSQGTLSVSMTVLPACDIRVDGRMSNAAMITCPATFPFRASIANTAQVGVIDPAGNGGTVFSGAGNVDLSWISGAGESSPTNDIRMLTISY